MIKDTNTKEIALILLFGTLWGLSEFSLGGWLYSNDIPHASIYVSTVACFVFAISKVFLSYRWTGTSIGLIAMLFKLANIPFFACHLLAIALLGTGFDIAYGLVFRSYSGRFRLPLVGLIGTYTGRALFAIVITYVIRYEYWTAAGLPKIIDFIFIYGTVSALFGAVAMSAGTVFGQGLNKLSWPKLHPQLSTFMILGTTLGIWILTVAV